MATFNWVTNNEGYSGMRSRHYPPGVEIKTITVPVTTIDQLLEKEKRKLSFIKLDLEGGEFCALLGAKQVIASHSPIIVFENGLERTCQFWDYTREEFFQFFEDLEYDVYELFLRHLTPEEWRNRIGWPWYFIALGRGSANQAMVKKIVHEFLVKEQRSNQA
jgi:hypothetical protein